MIDDRLWNSLSAQQGAQPQQTYVHSLMSLDELLERDKQREKDGFPTKIRLGQVTRRGRNGAKNKIAIVPVTTEDKFLHDNSVTYENEDKGEDALYQPEQTSGSGEEEEGEVIYQEKIMDGSEDEGNGQGGQGEGDEHELGFDPYELGKKLTEKIQLPNLKDKAKKRIPRYVYDLTDKHAGSGQMLDKKATLREIIKTNLALGTIPDLGSIDPSRLLVNPNDRIYRVFSMETEFESQALVFFLRDYSGSTVGEITQTILAQHLMLYSVLYYNYDKNVGTRFLLHDTQAKEVPDFASYYNYYSGGGTEVSSAYKLVNELVEKESLARDYNVYVFHGTDGEDWDREGKSAVAELRKMAEYASRIGITIVKSSYSGKSSMESFMEKSGLLSELPQIIRFNTLQENSSQDKVIDSIKELLAQ